MNHAIQHLRKLIHQAGLARVEEKIVAVAQPSNIFRTEFKSHGLSKFGGWPNLPKGELWPTFEGEPLDFVCQLEVPPGRTHDQPLLLMLFYDRINRPYWGASENTAFAVRCYSISAKLQKTSQSMGRALREQYLKPDLSYVLPRHQAWSLDGPNYKSLGLSESEREQYEDLLALIDEWEDGVSSVRARVFHHPEYWFESGLRIRGETPEQKLVQDSREAQDLEKAHAEWLPLIILPSLGESELVFGDMENLVVWIDLKAWELGDVTQTYLSIEG